MYGECPPGNPGPLTEGELQFLLSVLLRLQWALEFPGGFVKPLGPTWRDSSVPICRHSCPSLAHISGYYPQTFWSCRFGVRLMCILTAPQVILRQNICGPQFGKQQFCWCAECRLNRSNVGDLWQTTALGHTGWLRALESWILTPAAKGTELSQLAPIEPCSERDHWSGRVKKVGENGRMEATTALRSTLTARG